MISYKRFFVQVRANLTTVTRPSVVLPLIAVCSMIAACASGSQGIPKTAAVPASVPVQVTSIDRHDLEVGSPSEVIYGFTYHRPDGNRLVNGAGSFPSIEPLDIALGFDPQWVVGVAVSPGTVWLAASPQGEVRGFHLSADKVLEVEVDQGVLGVGQPPLMVFSNQLISILEAPNSNTSKLSHPIAVRGTEDIVWIDEQGAIVLFDGAGASSLDVQALPDARILQDETGRLLFLSTPTDSYDHGVLGDDLEASAITLVETSPEFRVVRTIQVNGGLVIEGIMPLWVDLTGDGQREIIVTASDRIGGARILAYSEEGDLLASGDPIGQGYRWRHQIAAAPQSLGEEPEIIVVRTPHIGGVIEYYRLIDGRLEIGATAQGVTSHVIGTRNLDLALVGDFDGDGRFETLLPDNDRRELVAIERTPGRAEHEWRLSLEGTMSSNLAAVTTEGNEIALGAGVAGGKLRIWSP